ncbi:unnamed protein product, partial [Clonostachys rhizophaga]
MALPPRVHEHVVPRRPSAAVYRRHVLLTPPAITGIVKHDGDECLAYSPFGALCSLGLAASLFQKRTLVTNRSSKGEGRKEMLILRMTSSPVLFTLGAVPPVASERGL